MCTWSPTRRIAASFRAVFPHALEAENGSVLIGSLTPIPFEPEAWAARAAGALSSLGPRRTRALLRALTRVQPAGPPPAVSLNHDLLPRDEFAVR